MKKLPLWIKIGLYAVIINIILFGIQYFAGEYCRSQVYQNQSTLDCDFLGFVNPIAVVSGLSVWLFILGDNGTAYTHLVTAFFLSLPISFIVGALISWIYSKLKK